MNDKKHTPPALGDVELVRKSNETWRIERNGETVATNVKFPDVLRVVRGELALEDLEAANGQR